MGIRYIYRERESIRVFLSNPINILVCKNKQELEQLVNTLSTTNRAEKALSKVITTEIYELAEKEEKKLLRKERAELRKLIPVEISITPTQLRSRGRSERVRYNYDDEDIYGIEEDRNDDDEFIEDEEEGEQQSNRRSSRRTTSSNYIERPPPTRWSSRLNGQQQTIEDDVEDMDTTPSESLMDISRSQSVVSVMDLDSTPQSAMEF